MPGPSALAAGLALLVGASGFSTPIHLDDGPSRPALRASQSTTPAPVAEPPDVVRAPQGRLPPRPTEVTPADDPPEGELVGSPAVSWLPASPGQDVQPRLRLVNGSEHELRVAVAPRSVDADDDGTPVATGERDGAAAWLQLLQPQVLLRAGEQADLWPTITIPSEAEPGNLPLAVVADADVPGDEQDVRVEMLLVVAVTEQDGDAGVSGITAPTLELHAGPRATTATITVRTEADAAAISGRLRADGWWTGASEVAIPPAIVLPDSTRVLEVGLRPPVLPDRIAVSAELVTPTGQTLELRTTSWLWHPLVAAAVAVALIAAAVTALRRARRRSEPPG